METQLLRQRGSLIGCLQDFVQPLIYALIVRRRLRKLSVAANHQRVLRATPEVQGGVERSRELDALEGLDDVAHRRQGARPGRGRLEADEDDRYSFLPVPERKGKLQAVLRCRLDQSDVDVERVRQLAVGKRWLMSELSDDEPEQVSDLLYRFCNQDTCHTPES
jgi:hypothetical protein